MALKRTRRLNRRGVLPVASLVAASVFLAAPARAEAAVGLHGFIKDNYLETLSLIPVLTLLGLLTLIVNIDNYIRPNLRRIMRVIIAVAFSLVAQNYIEYRAAAGDLPLLVRTLASIYGYAVRPVILILFLHIIAPQKRFGWTWALAGINAAVNATALFSHICFWIDANNAYHGGPLSNMCLWVSAILMVYWCYMTIRVFRPLPHLENWVPVLVTLLIAAAVALDYNVGYIPQPITYLTIAVVISCVMYYIWLHLQFVREHERALVTGQRVQLTLSQIKPHFLYNALNSISALSVEEPQRVKPAIDSFAEYLRGNMESIDETGPIPFKRELEHTKCYLEIEQLRFEDALQVRYDIACTDFRIPALTLEPLVENAVRHGVRMNKGGSGTVTISSRDAGDHFEVVIADDGPGFDPAQVHDDGKLHVGIVNVRERLAQVSGGRLEIRSVPGKGTTATILLPRKQEA